MDEDTPTQLNWFEKVLAKLKIRKLILLYVILPVIAVGLIFYALVQQGIIGGVRTATITAYVIDEKQSPIDQAIIVVGSLSGITGVDGRATIIGDIITKEVVQVSVRKTGFITHTQSLELKSGQHDLGTIVLKETPVTKVDITIRVEDYISESSLDNAVITLGDISGIYKNGDYSLSGVPVGAYSLTVNKGGYHTFTTNIEVAEDTVTLDKIQLVQTGLIVFESNRDRGKRGIFTSNYDGSNQQPLVNRVGDLEDYTPSLGPNQNKVFFTSTRDGEKRPNDPNRFKEYLYVVKLNGNNLIKISETSSSYTVWSPDGGYIGFTKYDENYTKNTLYTYDVVRKKLHKFTDYNSSSFSFSNNGNLIAFSAKKEGSAQRQLFFSKSNSTEIKTIAGDGIDESYNYYGIEFTGNDKIRYSYYDGVAKKTKWFEYTIASETTVEITAPAIDREGAVFSPDKKLRAYVSTRDGKTNLYISNADGKDENKLTELNSIVGGGLLWSKDSSFIMFNIRKPDESARYLVSINKTAPPKKIVDVNLTWYQ